ncbi:type II secretion system F family protein [Naasia aerilata]|uniref:Pilus assembly protein TadB n=1 Tax=Naasia aerilata TaxID=1162966 RepID=A0ABM8GBZ6_9MICO|nr:type II secretion system F family protein [Naasia aerilata]BDZ45762.1 pilus assembly protein TadB [Naasia aerilata]
MTVSPLDEVAATADRLATLLAAGLPPPTAWEHLRRTAPYSEPLAAVAHGSAAGDRIAEALAAAAPANAAGRPWRAIATGVALAERTGAPLADVLGRLAESLRDLAAAERDVIAALTGPRLSSRLVLALPAVGIAFGFALGFDPVAELLGTPIGLACGAAGAVLFLLGALWTRRLVGRARAANPVSGLALELVAVALAAGVPFDDARMLVRDAAHACGLPLDEDGVEEAGRLAGTAGVPVAPLLRGEARLLRRRATSDARVRAEALGVTLLLPLGICVLPAFMLLSVAPLMLSIVSSTVLPG